MNDGEIRMGDGPEFAAEEIFLPKKPAGHEYGYMEGDKPVDCSREELIAKCRVVNWNGEDIALAWTPETDRIVPVERISFLFEALRERRKKMAQQGFILSGAWAAVLLLECRGKSSFNLRHLAVFFGFATLLPAIYAFRTWRASNRLTPELLGLESGNVPFRLWFGRQKAPWTIGLGLLCAAVTLAEVFTPLSNGAIEAAALTRDAVVRGEVWRLLTCIFAHANIPHLLCNAMGLAVFGNALEVAFGRAYLAIVFLASALGGSVLSLVLNGHTSMGASGGVLGLAGFLAVTANRSRILQLLEIRETVGRTLLFTAMAGIIAFDLLDNAAHLGGVLAGMGLGWIIKAPKKSARMIAVNWAGACSCFVLLLGALLAIGLVLLPTSRTRVEESTGGGAASAKNPVAQLARPFQPVAPAEIPSVGKALADPDTNVAYVAAFRLSRLGQAAVPELTRSLSNSVPQARVWAACSLGMMGAAASNAAPVLAMLLQDPEPHVRIAAGYALRRMEAKPQAAPQAALQGVALHGTPIWKFWTATEHVDDPEGKVCVMRGEARWQPYPAAAGSSMVEGFVVDQADRPSASGFFLNVRPAAERYVWEVLPQATDLDPLLTALPDSSKGPYAAIALSRIGSPAISPLVGALGDPDAPVRERAAVALGWIGPGALEAIPDLVAMLQDESIQEDGHCRPCAAAVYALSNMGGVGLAALGALAESDRGLAGRYARAHLRLGPATGSPFPSSIHR